MQLAYISSNGLGDGVIHSVIAQNIARLVESPVRFVHPLLEPLAPILNRLEVMDLSYWDQFGSSEVDYILVDKGSSQLEALMSNSAMIQKLIVFSISKTRPDRNLFNSSLEQESSSGLYRLLNQLNGTSIRNFGWREQRTILQQFGLMLKELEIAKEFSEHPDLLIPSEWHSEKYNNRVIIHPFSSRAVKNWPTTKYVELAHRLQDKGLEIIFSIAPNEELQWQAVNGSMVFDTKIFSSIWELAKLYYQSGLLIGNDSGAGHLAALLRLPTITIMHRYRPGFAWRPAWGNNRMVQPSRYAFLLGRQYWKQTISERKVYDAVSASLSAA